jgi:TetR/AcrR family transcriptional regulator, tetracycline repressor protein
MVKINREVVIEHGLALLDEGGLDGFSTRRLAQRLGVEQPALYWHFKRKEDLLTAMAEAAMRPLSAAPLPTQGDPWDVWFAENFRLFRRTLLAHRDGARLHAGTFPSESDRDGIEAKITFLTDAGISVADAASAMMAAGQLTIGNALEAEATAGRGATAAEGHDYQAYFESGLRLIVGGMHARRTR